MPTKRKATKKKEETDSEASEEEVPKKAKRVTRAEREREKEREEEGEEQIAESKSFDAPLKEFGTIKRLEEGQVTFSFSNRSAQLKNMVQQMAQNYTKSGQPSRIIDSEDLYYLRTTLKNIVRAFNNQNNTKLEEDEDDASKGLDEWDTHVQQTQRNAETTTRNTYCPTQILPNGLPELIKWIDEEHADRIKNNQKNIEKKMISFDGLDELFKPGTKCCGTSVDTGSSLIGYNVVNCGYGSAQSFFSKYRWFTVMLEFLVAVNSTTVLIVSHTEDISYFPGTMPFDALHLKPMHPGLEALLADRGRKYMSIVSKPNCFMQYDTDCFQLHMSAMLVNGAMNAARSFKDSGASSFIRAKGRVMIDTETGRRAGHLPGERSPHIQTISQVTTQYQQLKVQKAQQAMYSMEQRLMYGYQRHGGHQQANNEMKAESVKDSILCLTWPCLIGFSFSSKIWGHVLVDGLSDVVFDDGAFEKLVISKNRKDLIHAMVKHSEGVFKDIISGKGGGSVFLLHGPPGVGKTLTAEAVSEMLHRPMYSLSLGELGTNPSELETKLKDILELATVWNAIVLMDEADIFLERRGKKEIVRNAMVGVLMKLIEYFQGVLFLTSNRVTTFDEAFYSRITVALKYDTLDKGIRKSIWKMLAESANIRGLDYDKLSSHILNGRQIKNCICLSQGLAKAAKTEVKPEHVDQTIEINLEFMREMELTTKDEDTQIEK